jgi:hypothetical protein
MSQILKDIFNRQWTKDGLLPVWMLFVSSLAIFNAVQNYLTVSLTKRVYSRTQQGILAAQERLPS